ncbi:MAG: MFS transporter [candidate division WOR-3 bacterium]
MVRRFAPVLRIRNFALLVSCASVSQFGDRLTHMLLITVIGASRPGSLLAFSAGSLVFIIPTMVVAPLAGVLADRWDKRRLVFLAHLAQSALLAVAALLIHWSGSFVPFWIALFLFFGLDVFNNAALPALVPRIVARRKLLLANSVNLAFGRIATILGMVAGGFLLRWTGWKYGMFINASTHLCAGLLAFAISGVRPKEPTVSAPHRTNLTVLVPHSFRRLVSDLAELVRVVAVDRVVAFVMASVVVATFVSSVSYTVLVFVVQQVLGLGTAGVGLAAGLMAVGMVAGAAGMGLLRVRVNRPMVVVGVIAGYGLLFLAGPVLLSIPFVAMVALAAGVMFSLLGIVQNTMVHETVEPEIQGRVFSTREFVVNLTFLLSTLLVGALGDLTSYRVVLVVIGLVLTGLAVLGWFAARKLGRAG